MRQCRERGEYRTDHGASEDLCGDDGVVLAGPADGAAIPKPILRVRRHMSAAVQVRGSLQARSSPRCEDRRRAPRAPSRPWSAVAALPPGARSGARLAPHGGVPLASSPDWRQAPTGMGHGSVRFRGKAVRFIDPYCPAPRTAPRWRAEAVLVAFSGTRGRGHPRRVTAHPGPQPRRAISSAIYRVAVVARHTWWVRSRSSQRRTGGGTVTSGKCRRDAPPVEWIVWDDDETGRRRSGGSASGEHVRSFAKGTAN